MKTINSEFFDEVVEDDGQKCLILFSRKTCPVCQKVHPKVEDLEDEFSEIPFYNVDVEESPELQAKLRLKGVPHVILFDDGEPVKRLSGNHSEDDYADMLS
ncbi:MULTISPECIES: thioredoxin family protein [unclassified Lactobacillus]|uniref:thioredoxin family protein n=1 Tax=unclassified Lactobacillus TaxID=2620435 RepID=UPI0023F82C42|nr:MULTISPECIES: thioredoxin family protein [unclassified Lactobacillus]MDF7668767.1 thioredoxin family protein [Lactobacillus sp. ESL0703]WEV38543.1 thioredoxin family protein [Lactobacillus sp. ESL0680]